MTGAQLYALRKRLALGRGAFGIALGYGGSLPTLRRKIRRYERWDGPLPGAVIVRARELAGLRSQEIDQRLAMLTPSRGRA